MFASFAIPWVHPADVTYIGRGRYRVECIWARGWYAHNVVVEMK
jgi:hypothetical protein